MVLADVLAVATLEPSEKAAAFGAATDAPEVQFLISHITDDIMIKNNGNKIDMVIGRRCDCRHEEEILEEKCSAGELQLVDYYSLPAFLKHNEFIVNYYRSEWPLKDSFLSAFSIHNETINVWTHLIGFFIFLTLTAYAVTMVPVDAGVATAAALRHLPDPMNSSSTSMTYYEGRAPDALASLPQANLSSAISTKESEAEPAQAAASRWPFYIYLCGAMFCLLMSSACHLLSCHSERTCYVMLRLDYAGITALIVTSFYPLVYYSFACDPFYRVLYLSFITAFGAAAVVVSLVPAFETPELRVARAALFACMALSGLVPIVHKTMLFGDRPEAVLTTGYEMLMGAFYALGAVVYATRVPERWMPGKFDLAGHSHQLFHVLVIAGAYAHYMAALVYLRWRDVEGCYMN